MAITIQQSEMHSLGIQCVFVHLDMTVTYHHNDGEMPELVPVLTVHVSQTYLQQI